MFLPLLFSIFHFFHFYILFIKQPFSQMHIFQWSILVFIPKQLSPLELNFLKKLGFSLSETNCFDKDKYSSNNGHN